MKKTIKILLIIFIIVFLKLIYSYTVNSFIISNYNSDVYNTKIVKLLYFGNFPESYVAHYNEGNILYRKGNYKKALTKYKKALKKNPPKGKKCDIRINMSLSMLKLIDSNNDNKTILKELKEARENLYNHHCADENDDSGYSYEAEQLEDEIRKLEEQYQNQDGGGSGDDPNEDPNEDPDDGDDYSEIEQEFKDKEKQNNSNRQDDLNEYENQYTYYNGDKW